MADVLKKVPVREQEPKVRATNFEEVCYGYNKEEAMEEATRCLNCKNARCIQFFFEFLFVDSEFFQSLRNIHLCIELINLCTQAVDQSFF